MVVAKERKLKPQQYKHIGVIKLNTLEWFKEAESRGFFVFC